MLISSEMYKLSSLSIATKFGQLISPSHFPSLPNVRRNLPALLNIWTLLLPACETRSSEHIPIHTVCQEGTLRGEEFAGFIRVGELLRWGTSYLRGEVLLGRRRCFLREGLLRRKGLTRRGSPYLRGGSLLGQESLSWNGGYLLEKLRREITWKGEVLLRKGMPYSRGKEPILAWSTLIYNDNAIFAINSYPHRSPKLSLASPFSPKRLDENTVTCKQLNTIVQTVGDNNGAIMKYCHSGRTVELTSIAAARAKLKKKIPIIWENLQFQKFDVRFRPRKTKPLELLPLISRPNMVRIRSKICPPHSGLTPQGPCCWARTGVAIKLNPSSNIMK